MAAYPKHIYGTPNHSWPVMQPGFEPETAVTPLALRCSALDHCTTQEPICSQGGRQAVNNTMAECVSLFPFCHSEVGQEVKLCCPCGLNVGCS